MDRPDFQNRPLTNSVAVGAVDAHRGRIWMCCKRPGRFELECHAADASSPAVAMQLDVPEDNATDNTIAVDVPAAGSPQLEPLTRYEFRITRIEDGELIGAGQFETAPESPDDTPDRFSIALLSCNQPFEDDGSYNENSLNMLRAARTALQQHACKMLFMVGDQMYSDLPAGLSLFREEHYRQVAPPGRESLLDCTPEEVRRLFQRRYRHFFAADAWQQITASMPCYPIFDDHEIVDNWGSVAEHQELPWQSIWQGARRSYADYQASRVFEHAIERDHFGYEVVYGNTATYVLDLRSHRHGNGGGLLSDQQFVEFDAFLQRHTDKLALFVVLSVPPVHLPRWVSRFASRWLHAVEDFSDRWSAPGHLRDRDRLLQMLHDHQRSVPGQPVVLLSGDIHIGCAHQIRWNDGTTPLAQIISSPIAHGRWWLETLAAKLSIQMNRRITTRDGRLSAAIRRLPAAAGDAKTNPYGGLNLGMIEISRDDDEQWQIRLMLYGHENGAPKCVYRSEPLATAARTPANHATRGQGDIVAETYVYSESS